MHSHVKNVIQKSTSARWLWYYWREGACVCNFTADFANPMQACCVSEIDVQPTLLKLSGVERGGYTWVECSPGKDVHSIRYTGCQVLTTPSLLTPHSPANVKYPCSELINISIKNCKCQKLIFKYEAFYNIYLIVILIRRFLIYHQLPYLQWK